MGLFSFVAAAGRLLGIGKAEATQDASHPVPPPPDAAAVQAELTRLGVAPADLQVTVEGDRVRLAGTAPDAATRERMILAAGNVAGIAAVEETVTTAAPAPDPVFHTVVRGETLSKIAQQHLGNANKYPAIFEANKPMLTNPDKIYPGQVLRIPAQG